MDPELIRTIEARARRERAEAVHRLLIAPLKRLLHRRGADAHRGHPPKASRAAA